MKKIILAALFAVAGLQANAGGLLTNTNQSINFLRNPARDGAIGLDGVYSNPAGVAFLNEGFHIGLNWQAAWQTREITSTNPVLFVMNANDPSTTKKFKGEASAPFIPSIQAAYNTGKWAFMFNFSVHGGGGKCTFDNGIGTFEEALGSIAKGMEGLGAQGFTANSFMQGKQYYFGFTLGAAYKVNEHLSVSAGLRAIYGSASYKAKIDNIMVKTANGNVPFNMFLAGGNSALNTKYAQLMGLVGAADDAHMAAIYSQMKQNYAALPETQKQVVDGYEDIMKGMATINGLEKYSEGVNLQSDQSAFGIAPIIGVDYKIGNFNFAAKYEFRTKMAMKNKSTLAQAGLLKPLAKFEDGSSVREDNPAMLSLGAQWNALPNLHINAGYHHFYDCDSKKYNNDQDLLDGGTNEYLAGVEYDINDKLTVSGGAQVTRYGLTDAFMNDMSFVCNSWSFGLGAAYKVTDKVKVEVAYFQTNYDKYNTSTPNANGTMNEFYRTNRVLGAGVTFDF